MNEKYKKICKYLIYVELFLILASTVTGFVSLFAIPVGITSSAVQIKVCTFIGGIKKYKLIIKKKKKKHDKIVLLGKVS